MKRLFTIFISLSLFAILLPTIQCSQVTQPDEYYCSLFSTEPEQTSVILQARLHKSDTLINHDIEGIEGFVKFTITRDIDSEFLMESGFFHANNANDFIVRYKFTGLRPGNKYFYRISYGRDTANVTTSRWSTLTTLKLPMSDQSVNFVIVSGILEAVSTHWAEDNFNLIKNPENQIFNSIELVHPEFLVCAANRTEANLNGETLPETNFSKSKNWHLLFTIPEFDQVIRKVPLFRVSYVDEYSDPFRTYRLNKDIQVWMLQKTHISKNLSIDGSLEIFGWGNAQLKWLKSTLKESTAPFKIIINSEPLINSPFQNIQAEKDTLFIWLKNNGFLHNGLFFIAGGSDGQFHTIDPSGFEEFGCGNFYMNEKLASDAIPDSIIIPETAILTQPYIQENASGGFLAVTSGRDEFNSPFLVLRYFDAQKKLLYAVKKY